MTVMSEQGFKILHIEDNEQHRYIVRRMLERAGFSVSAATTGGEGFQSATSNPFDLIILDIRLPDMSGLEVCQRLKSDPHTCRVPVLHLSAHYTKAEDRALGLEHGADGYLVHPAEPIELVATIRALLRTRKAEDELARSLEREKAARREAEVLYNTAKKANLAKDEFLATLSHELRTPLNVILGHAELLLQMGTDNPEDTRTSLEAIQRGALQQADLINDLLDVSRIISGKLKLQETAVELGTVIQEAIAGQQLAANAKGVSLIFQNTLPLGKVMGDPTRLQQVMWNLVGNAVKFTPRGGQITISCLQKDRSAIIEVSDTGEGIGPTFLPHVFDRLRQEDSSLSRQHGGLGLGLAITRHIVELHGGTIEARSPGKGRGATFTVTIPLASANDNSSLATDAEPAGFAALGGLEIMVVEDDASSRLLAQTVLEQASAQVVAFGSGADALHWIQEHERCPDVFLLDIHLPGEDGLSLLRSVRACNDARGRPTRAVALTGYDDARKTQEILSAGFSHCAIKPVDWKRLTGTLAELCQRLPPPG